MDSLPSESPGKPKNTGVDSLPLLQRILPSQGLNPGLLHCRQILYHVSRQGSIGDRKIIIVPVLLKQWELDRGNWGMTEIGAHGDSNSRRLHKENRTRIGPKVREHRIAQWDRGLN